MKQVTTPSRDLVRYFPAGQPKRDGSIRENSFLQIDKSLVANHDPKERVIKTYSAFGVLADQINGLIDGGIRSFHVNVFEARDKRYGQTERKILSCNPIIDNTVATDIEMLDPEFTPAQDAEQLTSADSVKNFLASFTAPDANATSTKPMPDWV